MRQVQNNWLILSNAGSLFATRGITSVLGFVFWWLAAQRFAPHAVGLASAAISTMLLLSTVGVAGLDTLLVGELPRRPHQAGSLISTASLLAGLLCAALGLLFALLARFLSPELAFLSQRPASMLLFTAGIALTGVSLVMDQAMIGLLQGGIQLARNMIISTVKLVLIWGLTLWAGSSNGMVIYLSWVTGSLVSLLVIGLALHIKHVDIFRLPDLRNIPELGKPALGHYALNLALQGPGFILPMLVTISLSVTQTAYYYAAWMIAGISFIVPLALSTVLFAVGAGAPELLQSKSRVTLKVSLWLGGMISAAILLSADFILDLFNPSYAIEASLALRILSLGVLPLTVKYHYVAICRVRNHLNRATWLMSAASALELVLAGFGAYKGDLAGLSLGWFIALCLEAVLMFPLVYRTSIGQPASQVANYKSTA